MEVCERCEGEGDVTVVRRAGRRARNRRRVAGFINTLVPDAILDDDDDTVATRAPCGACDGRGVVPNGNSTQRPPLVSSSPHIGKRNSRVGVAIVGGGLSGAALALSLQHRKIPCVVFERDASFEARTQGYALTLQQGAVGLRSLGVRVDGVSPARHVAIDARTGDALGAYEARATPVEDGGPNTANGTKKKKNKHGGRSRRRPANVVAPRQRVRAALLRELAPGTVRYGWRFVGFEEEEEEDKEEEEEVRGGVVASERDDETRPRQRSAVSRCGEGVRRLRFARDDDAEEVLVAADVCVGEPESRGERGHPVGADGARSAVRRCLLGDAEDGEYVGLFVSLGVVDASAIRPDLRGATWQALDGATRIYVMPFDGDFQAFGAYFASTEAGSSQEDARSCPRDARSGADDDDDDDEPPATKTRVMWQLSWRVENVETASHLARSGGACILRECAVRVAAWRGCDDARRAVGATAASDVVAYAVRSATHVAPLPKPSSASLWPKKTSPRVVLIGDARGAMTPFKGQGANQAILDAVDLGRALRRAVASHVVRDDTHTSGGNALSLTFSPSALDDELDEFARACVARVRPKLDLSLENARLLHSDAALTIADVARADAARRAHGVAAQKDKDRDFDGDA